MPRKKTGRTGIIVQARMNSSRLQAKVLKPIMGKPMLGYQVERLRCVPNAQEIIIATTTNEQDGAIVEYCKHLGVSVFRGSEDDVLSRYYEAAKSFNLDYVVRVTADCPAIDPAISARVIERFLENESVDYVSNAITRSFPRGMDTEVFTFKTLQICQKEAVLKYEREHVTPFIYCHPERFKIDEVIHPENLSRFRWTVDTEEDFELMKRIFEALYPTKPQFEMADCLALLEKHPDWQLLNAGIKQKAYWE